MVCGMKMFGGVLIFGGIAAANMPALQADAQVYPGITRFQTVLTTISARCDVAYLVKMRTLLCHRNLLCVLWPVNEFNHPETVIRAASVVSCSFPIIARFTAASRFCW